jgi:hypothetical protein
MKLLAIAAAIASVFCSSYLTPVNAAVVFEQPGNDRACTPVCANSTITGGFPIIGSLTWENFTFLHDTTFNGILLDGFVYDPNSANNLTITLAAFW